jgi:hypothetical protein
MTLRGENTPASRLRSLIIGSDEELSPVVAALGGRTTFAWFGRYLEKDLRATIARCLSNYNRCYKPCNS